MPRLRRADGKKCLHCVGTYNTIGACEENTNFHPAVLGTRITTAIDSLSEQVTAVRLNKLEDTPIDVVVAVAWVSSSLCGAVMG